MNCGALRAISDEVQMQTANSTTPQQRKMHSMPRTVPQNSQNSQNSTPNPATRTMEQQPPPTSALRRSTMPRGRGLASCLRGERDDAPTPPIHGTMNTDVEILQALQLMKGSEQERVSGTGSGASTLEATGRSKYIWHLKLKNHWVIEKLISQSN